jgi:predicted RNase H-like HicB family nuclease
MRKYLVIIEKGSDGYGAYSPDIPGCVAVAETQEEVEQKMYEAITFHLDGLREEGMPIPYGQSVAEYVVLPEAI